MRSFLFVFGYSWPSDIAWCEAHPEADLAEASACAFIVAADEQMALELGELLAEQFIDNLYGSRPRSWSSQGFSRWIEHDPIALDLAREHRVPTLESRIDITKTAAALAAGARNVDQP